MAGRQDGCSVSYLSAMSDRRKACVDANTVVTTYLEKSESESLGDSTMPTPPQLTPAEEEKLWLKLDRRLLPILALMYLMSYMDRCTVVVPLL